MVMTEPPHPSAEALLLRDALLRRGWKAPELARAIGMSNDWVRVLVRGYRNIGKGRYEQNVPDAVALANAAKALGNITEDELRHIGRADAARALEVLRRDAPASGTVVARLTRVRDDLDTLIRELGPQ